MNSIIETVEIYKNPDDICYKAKLQYLILKILIEIRTYHTKSISVPKYDIKFFKEVKDAILYIQSNYDKKITLEELSKETYIDKYTLSKKFKEFDKFIKKSKAKYLLKYDRVQLIEGFFTKHAKIYSVANVEKDFPDMPEAFAAYIKLHSLQKKQGRISARINRLYKYYTKPTELFARFVEGLYKDKEWTCALAPYTNEIFYKRLEEGYYGKLKEVLENLG